MSAGLSIFFRSLATMFGAGVPLVSCFEQLELQAHSAASAFIPRDISRRLQQGERLHFAFECHRHFFTGLHVHMIKVGTDTGMLELILRQLALYEEKKRALLLKVRSTLIYPLAVFGISLVGLMFLPTVVMGGLLDTLRESSNRLPLLTRVIITWSDLLTSAWFYPFLALSLVLGMPLVKAAWNQDRFRSLVFQAVLSVPPLFRFLQLLVTLRFGRCLELQARAGVNLVVALPAAAAASNFEPAQPMGREMVERLKAGETLSEAMEEQAILDKMFVEMVRVGEESGKLSLAVSKACDLLEQEFTHILEVTVGLLEPLIFLILGAIVGVFVLGVALPLVQLLQTIS